MIYYNYDAYVCYVMLCYVYMMYILFILYVYVYICVCMNRLLYLYDELVIRYELVRENLKNGMSAIEALKKAYDDVYGQ